MGKIALGKSCRYHFRPQVPPGIEKWRKVEVPLKEKDRAKEP